MVESFWNQLESMESLGISGITWNHSESMESLRINRITQNHSESEGGIS
jgi:hypothetical protein